MTTVNLHGPTRMTFIEHLRSNKIAYVVGAIVAVCGILYHFRSYSRHDSIVVCDIAIDSDDGLMSFEIPVSRIASDEQPVTRFTFLHHRDKDGFWIYSQQSGNRKVPIRILAHRISEEKGRFSGGMVSDFGCFGGQWGDASRLAKMMFIAPIWFVFLSIYGIFFAFYRGWIRFRLRTLFIITAVFAGLFWLLMLRAPA